jgi:hypothetical protein
LDGHRKCWFQAAEGIATVKKRVRHHVAKHGVVAPAENETAQRRRGAVVDAHAEVLRSPLETSQPTPLASELKVVDAASVVPTGAAAPAPPALVANRASDQLTPRQQVDVEAILAAASAASDAVAASVPPAFPIAEASDDRWGWTANWLGMLLMALGLVSVLSSSRFLRGAVLLRS